VNGNILVTGHSGYLASALTKELDCNIIEYAGDVRVYKQYSNISYVVHFASPSDKYEFVDEYRTITTIMNGTMNMLRVARDNNCKFIYASTLGVKYINSTADIYTVSKLAMENLIKVSYNDYVILRIPRVCSKCRNKGSMKQLKDQTVPEQDMDKTVEFITLDDFVNQTKPAIELTQTIYEYDITNTNTIREIDRWLKE